MLSTASLTIRLHPQDDVVIARQQLVSGTLLRDENITVAGLIPPGHKVATRAIAQGEPVKRYNQIIGFASRPILPGQQVHLNNLAMGEFARDYAFGADVKAEPKPRKASFMGYKRADGRVATRNYIGILSSVNCSATAARAIADCLKLRSSIISAILSPNLNVLPPFKSSCILYMSIIIHNTCTVKTNNQVFCTFCLDNIGIIPPKQKNPAALSSDGVQKGYEGPGRVRGC